AAYLRVSSGSNLVHRVSILIFRPVNPARLREPLQERPDPGLKFRIVRGCRQQHADAPHPLRLLRARRERPRRRRAADQRNELAAAAHSITSSARNRIAVGSSMPIALAVLRLTTSSNFVACSTGRSAGFVPLRIFAV